MSVFQPRNKLTPSQFQWAEDAYKLVVENPWHHNEVSMTSDIQGWEKLPIADKNVIAGILQGFTKMETVVGDYWSVVADWFQCPEIVAMCRAFSYQETIHAYAYEYLEASLGLDTTNEFLANRSAKDKLNNFADPSDSPLNTQQLANMLAKFSGCGEGVSLFASFAVLLSYDSELYNLKGLRQILSWSVRDENLHSDCAALLFKQVCSEIDYRPEHDLVAKYFDDAVANELAFISPFLKGKTTGITEEQITEFLFHRANNRLENLGYTGIYVTNDDAVQSVANWFYPKVQGTTLHDFFVSKHNGSAYSASAGADLNTVDIGDLF